MVQSLLWHLPSTSLWPCSCFDFHHYTCFLSPRDMVPVQRVRWSLSTIRCFPSPPLQNEMMKKLAPSQVTNRSWMFLIKGKYSKQLKIVWVWHVSYSWHYKVPLATLVVAYRPTALDNLWHYKPKRCHHPRILALNCRPRETVEWWLALHRDPRRFNSQHPIHWVSPGMITKCRVRSNHWAYHQMWPSQP